MNKEIKHAAADDEDEDDNNDDDIDVGLNNIFRCIFLTLHHPTFSPLAQFFALFMGVTVVVSCLAFVLSTIPRFEYQPSTCRNPTCIPGPDSECTRIICHPIPYWEFFVVEAVTVSTRNPHVPYKHVEEEARSRTLIPTITSFRLVRLQFLPSSMWYECAPSSVFLND